MAAASRSTVNWRGRLALLGLIAACALVLPASASADYVYRATFSGPAELEAPRRAAVEQATGNIFVVDSGHDRVLVFKPEGSSGSILTELGVGVLDDPYGIALEESGAQTRIYVADGGNDRIVRFLSDEQATPSFSVDATYTSPAKGAEADEIASFESPLALAPNGDIWVADRGANVVKRFDATGAHVGGSNFDGSSSPGGAFTGLFDLAVNSGGDLYVLDTTGDTSQESGTGRVERFSEAGAHVASLVGAGSHPGALAVNPANDSVVVSGNQDSVYTNIAPSLHFFDATNALTGEAALAFSTWETVQGLAFRDAPRDFLYAVIDVGLWNGFPFGAAGIESLEDAPLPQLTIDPPSGVTGTEAQIAGTVNPRGSAATWKVEYKPASGFDWESTPEQNLAAVEEPVPVAATLTGLVPGRKYLPRLCASTSDGTAASATVSFITDTVPPQITQQQATAAVDSATLKATVDPGGSEATYFFEYGPTPSYGSKTPLRKILPGLPSSAFATVTGLAPATTYHYRIVASNPKATVEGPDGTFTTKAADDPCPNAAYRKGAAAWLTDCRAYELVTPPDSAADIRINGGPASLDGTIVCFNTEDPLAGSDPNGIKTADDGFCAWRQADGWETKWVTGPEPPQRVASMGSNIYYLSPDGRRAVFASDAVIFGDDAVPPPGSTYGSPPSAYMWEEGATTWLAPGAPPVGDPPVYPYEGKSRLPNTNEMGGSNYRRPIAVSEDLRHGVFESDLPLVPTDENEVVDLYEWYPGGLRLVSRDSSGKAAGGRAALQANLQTVAPPGTVSADGGRIFFQHDGPLAGAPGAAPEGPDPEAGGIGAMIQSVYMREGDQVILVSPRRGTGPDASVWFAGASSDGDLAYLETTQQLTAESKESGRAIYSYDVPSDELELVADAPGGVNLIASSADASTIVYFEPASDQLIVERNGVATPLGTLSESDRQRSDRVASVRIDERALRITADGRVVVFAAAGEFAGHGPGTVQVYRWEDGAGLERISAESGAPEPTANASIGAYPGVAEPRQELFANHRSRANLGRVISDDGSRVFFETPEALVERDINGITDVYEWHDGEIELVSPGTGAKALYHESSADGRTVFFTTFEPLLPEWDRNSKRDVYAARPDGGFAPPAAPPACEGEACQPVRPAPPSGEPGSVAVSDGNMTPAPKIVALGKKQLRLLARKGRTTVKVEIAAPGRVTMLLKAKVGGRNAIVARAAKEAFRSGTISLLLKLSKGAREQLRERGKLRLNLEVRHSRSDQTARKAVMLRG